MKTRTSNAVLLLALVAIVAACGSKMESETELAGAEATAGNQPEVEYKTYGAEPRLEGPALTLAQALEKHDSGEMVKVSATVNDVCRKKGCWMMLKENDTEIRVTFKDYGFFVPVDCDGDQVIIEGFVSETILTEADARHYAEDAGMSRADIEKIVGDQKEYSIVAESVLMAHHKHEHDEHHGHDHEDGHNHDHDH